MNAAALPTGTVTFLFTDIEGSSRLWERSAEAMHVALADHDALLRQAIEKHHGVVFKTIGDAFCSVFGSPEEAIEAAVDAQRAFAEHQWPADVGELRVRMGIHSGQTTQRDGDYFGPTVNRVARIMAIGSGGQILASSATAALLAESPASTRTLLDLGTHRLRDLSRIESVFQVVADDLRRDFPALASLDVNPNNLPSQFSSFIGRQRETDDLRGLLLAQRLVTIAGLGGIGKTRLALHVAAATIGDFKDGAWLVELSAIADPALVAQAIARTLGVREVRGEPILETLLGYLGAREMLLIVDNCEHLLAGVASVVREILSRCGRVTLLATSREPLHLTGEHVFRLEGMPVVAAAALLTEVAQHDSARLFLDRAQAVAPALTVADRDAPDIAGICRQLQGIPLAIELAAARVSTLSIHQLNQRLSKKLPLLTSRDSTLGRHRTLRATIEWSYRLLSDDEKEVFAKLSVFSGGFTLEACERVAYAGGSQSIDVLGSLVEKSLVQIDPDSANHRFRILDAVAEFAADELTATNASVQAGEDHARYYAELVTRGRTMSGDDLVAWYKQLDLENHNLRVALEWCLERDPPLAAQLALDLCAYWRVRGTITEARGRLATLLGKPGTSKNDRAALLCQAAAFATMQDDFVASLASSNEALTIYRSTGDSLGAGEVLFRIAEVEHRKGRLDEARRLYEEARVPFASAGNLRGQMLCIGNLGMLARQQGDYETAKTLLEDALAHAAASGESRIAGEMSIHLGWVNLYLDDPARSKELFERALEHGRSERDPYEACAAQQGLGTIALKSGQHDEAYAAFASAIETAFELRLQDYVFRGFHGIGAVFALRGDAQRAARYVGLAERLFRESDRELRDSIAYDIASQALRELPDGARANLEAEGAAMPVEEAIAGLRDAPRSSASMLRRA